MSRITHWAPLPMNIDRWDYYIICGDIDTARVLQRIEYWDGVKFASSPQAEAHNEQLQEAGLEATQDASLYFWKSEEELQWELFGSIGEKKLSQILKSLVAKQYVSVRNNPYRGFDRTKQYLLQAEKIQEDLDKLRAIIQHQAGSIRPVQYAIELLLFKSGYTFQELSEDLVRQKLHEMYEIVIQEEQQNSSKKSSLPHFIRTAIKSDLNSEAPFRKIAGSIPQNRGSNTRDYNRDYNRDYRSKRAHSSSICSCFNSFSLSIFICRRNYKALGIPAR